MCVFSKTIRLFFQSFSSPPLAGLIKLLFYDFVDLRAKKKMLIVFSVYGGPNAMADMERVAREYATGTSETMTPETCIFSQRLIEI